MVIKTLATHGTGFDCASKAEVQMVLDAGVNASRIIYANPCKQSSHIRYAAARDVNIMTFDNADELYKIKSIAPNSQLVLRILTDDSKSLCRFGVKFGASLSIVPSLLSIAKKLNLKVIGISFHVGSGCFDASSFTDAVELARKAFDIGASLGFDFSLLDIGGGFPGNRPDGLQFKDIAASLGPCIDRLFPSSVKVISEPGRYFVSSAFTLATNIVARRVVSRDATQAESSLDDHPSFMCTMLLI
jgi:ornithine decarboxylase